MMLDEDPVAHGGQGFTRGGGLSKDAAHSGPELARGRQYAIEATVFFRNAGRLEARDGEFLVLLFKETAPA